jgi:nucleoside-diphosphate-sugar epimerase
MLGINRATILRISAPYGPGQRNRTVLRIFIERAISSMDLLYFGTGDRTQDFTSATDVAQAVICSIRRKRGGVFNIAGGNPISMKELAKLVVKCVSGCRSKIVPAGVPDSQESYRADFEILKAKRELGWAPQISLTEGVKQWIGFLRQAR